MKKTELEQNKALAEQYMKAWNEEDFEAYYDAIAADYVFHFLPTNTTMSREEMKGNIMMMRSAFSDLKVSIQDTIAEGDKVAVRLILTGTHDGDFIWGPNIVLPTGVKIEFNSMIILRIEDGKIVEEKEVYDQLDFFESFGMELKPKEAK